jgi:hypothetical protein
LLGWYHRFFSSSPSSFMQQGYGTCPISLG